MKAHDFPHDEHELDSPFLNEMQWEEESPFLPAYYEVEPASPFLEREAFEAEEDGHYGRAPYGEEEYIWADYEEEGPEEDLFPNEEEAYIMDRMSEQYEMEEYTGQEMEEWESEEADPEEEVIMDIALELEMSFITENEYEADRYFGGELNAADSNQGLSPVASQSLKRWDKVAGDRPAQWIGKVYGLVVHTTGGSLPGKAIAGGKYPTDRAVDYYTNKDTRGCHYINGWKGLEGQDLVQIANERKKPKGVGTVEQRESIKKGRFEADLPDVLVEIWRRRWPGYDNSLALLPALPNECCIHVECIPVYYYMNDRSHISREHPPMRPGLRFTKAQHDTIALLACDIAVRNGWPLNEKWWRTPRLLGHEDITPISRKDKNGGWDPGYLRRAPYFDWDYVYLKIEEIARSGYKLTAGYSAPAQPAGPQTSIGNLPGTLASRLTDLINKGVIGLSIFTAIMAGERDANRLTDMIFFHRHPERDGRRIGKDEKDAIREWSDIKAAVVGPLLRKISEWAPASGGAGGTTGPTGGQAQNTLSSGLNFQNLGAGKAPPTDPGTYRKFRLTTYHIADQRDYPTGSVMVPFYGEDGHKIAEGSPEFFANASLEGTGKLLNGQLINVTGKKVKVSHDEYRAVLEYHNRAYARTNEKRRAQGRAPISTGYSGISVETGRVVRTLAFHIIPKTKLGAGYGVRRNIPLLPFRTLAADIGIEKYKNADPKWKGKGGLVPPGTRVYIKEYDGLQLPDGSLHDGWFIVNDTGGGIYGVHFDVFTGTRALRKQVKLPEFGQVWFEGIESRIPPGYSHGLKP